MKTDLLSSKARPLRAPASLFGALFVTAFAAECFAEVAPAEPASAPSASPTAASPPPSAAAVEGTSEPNEAQPLPTPADIAEPAAAEPASEPSAEASEPSGGRIVVVAGPVERRERLPVRAERRLVLVGELGWNSLAGFGPNIGFHAHPHFTIEMGGGLSLEGWKLGLRGRVNWLKAPVTPFVGLGAMVTTGLGETLDITDDATGRTLNVRVLPSSYLQFVAGVDWTSRSGFTLIGALGYAHLLRDRNYEIVAGEPNADERRALKLAFESGIVISLAIGYSFR